MDLKSVWIGYDSRRRHPFEVTLSSVTRNVRGTQVNAVVLERLCRNGEYRRPMEMIDGVLWDLISQAPMSTEFAISRFLVPHLAKTGWALFMDGDMLVRHNLSEAFEQADPTKAVMCVKHNYVPTDGTKMDGQAQTNYACKNWSSFMLFNCDHPANRALTLDLINTARGRDLHQFCWLSENDIGELGPEWNWLVGHSSPDIDPKVVHFTEGTPDMPGYEHVPYADEWREELRRWAA